MTTKELLNLITHPKINDISLKLLLEFYEEYLVPNTFLYVIKPSDNLSVESVIELSFPPENFCHLVGIETIVKRNVPRWKLSEYKGLKGWDNIKNDSMTFTSLKNINKSMFNSVKAKFVFFYLLPKILNSPKCIRFNKIDESNIECSIIFYNNNNVAYIHLGIDYDEEIDKYYARTFFVEKITSTNDGMKFIKGQSSETVTDKIIIVNDSDTNAS